MNHLTRTASLVFLSALLVAPAAAQVRIGQVTLTTVKSTPVPPAPAGSASDYAFQPVPSGMNELRGRISSPAGRQSLPTSSSIRVSVIDTGVLPVRGVSSAAFSTTRLPTSYQLFYGRTRLLSGHPYVVRCVVTAPSGRVLYRSVDVPLPHLPRAVLDLALSASSPGP